MQAVFNRNLFKLRVQAGRWQRLILTGYLTVMLLINMKPALALAEGGIISNALTSLMGDLSLAMAVVAGVAAIMFFLAGRIMPAILSIAVGALISVLIGSPDIFKDLGAGLTDNFGLGSGSSSSSSSSGTR